MLEFLLGLALVVPAFAGLVVAARRDPEIRVWLRSLTRVVALAIPFSLIPGIAFYPAITTVSCFYFLTATLCALASIRAIAHASQKKRCLSWEM